MRGATVASAIALLLASGGDLGAGEVGPALDASVGVGGLSLGGVGAIAFARVGIGLQVGRTAVLVHGELAKIGPGDPELDSRTLTSAGAGLGLRLELARRPSWHAHLQLGVTARALDGSGEVVRRCSVFGPCDAGYYRETPHYATYTPFVGVAIGAREPRRRWPGLGIQLEVGLFEIDRARRAPDDLGVEVTLALHLAVGR